MLAIEAHNVSIRYFTGDFKDIGIKEYILRKITGKYQVNEFWAIKDVSFTLDAADRHAVAYCMTTGTYTQMLKEQSPTLMARDYKDPPVVNETEPEYIVRRLMPTECARLQGFPDWWCTGLETDEPSEEEIEFWTEVFEIHRSVMGKSSRPKSRNQIIKWLKNPHSDSAEYKMWGNGVALPNVFFVLSGIVYYSQFPEFLL